MTTKIIGTGSYVPAQIVTNDDLSKIVETNDQWIRSRTGIGERRIATDDSTSDMAAKAAARAIGARRELIRGDRPDHPGYFITGLLLPKWSLRGTGESWRSECSLL